MLKQKYICPLCEGTMIFKDTGDRVMILKCEACNSEIHFGSWEIHNKFVNGQKGEKTNAN
jgi:DNA-directed RNA polymerase subunit M/transcription elongation factor TFIIS